MTTSNECDFENAATGPMDETDASLRTYVAKIPDEKLAKYDPKWTDEQVIEWDDNFRNDGALMLVCCERDVDVEEFRKVVEERVRFPKQGCGC